MQFILEPPQQIEVTKVEMQDRAITSTPVMLRSQHIIRAAYLTAQGDGGTEAKAVVMFNANTGEFSIQRVGGDPVTFDFDLPKEEFMQKRQANRRAGQVGGKKASANRKGDDEDDDDETAD